MLSQHYVFADSQLTPLLGATRKTTDQELIAVAASSDQLVDIPQRGLRYALVAIEVLPRWINLRPLNKILLNTCSI